MTGVEDSGQILEVIRRKEAEVKRRLAAEREAAEDVLAKAGQQARALLIAAEIEGRRTGEAQRQAAQAEAECEAQSIGAQARAEAELLLRVRQQHMDATVAHAFEIVIGGQHEA